MTAEDEPKSVAQVFGGHRPPLQTAQNFALHEDRARVSGTSQLQTKDLL
jgi:hypothetical protein